MSSHKGAWNLENIVLEAIHVFLLVLIYCYLLFTYLCFIYLLQYLEKCLESNWLWVYMG